MRRYNGKGTRELVRKIRAAGGEVRLTGNGHLTVTGPTGRTTIGSRHGATDRRGWLNQVATLRRATGLDLR